MESSKVDFPDPDSPVSKVESLKFHSRDSIVPQFNVISFWIFIVYSASSLAGPSSGGEYTPA